MVLDTILVSDPADDEVTLIWTGAEGATYEVQTSSDLGNNDEWSGVGPQLTAGNSALTYNYFPGGIRPDRQFYRGNQINLAPFDDSGFEYEETDPTDLEGSLSTITITVSGGPTNLATLPSSLSFAGQAIDVLNANVSRPSETELSFEFPIDVLTPGDFTVSATYTGEPSQSGTYTAATNILLMIVDDWGIDASPLDNPLPDAQLANMPNLQLLADEGVRFTRAYSQPTCSPMRARC